MKTIDNCSRAVPIDVGGTKDYKRFPLPAQNVRFDNGCSGTIALVLERRLWRVNPVNGPIARQNTHTLSLRQAGIDFAYGVQKISIKGRVPCARLGRILPDLPQVRWQYRVSTDVAVEEILVNRIGELDHEIIYDLGDGRTPNEFQPELGILQCTVPLSKRDQVGALEGFDDALYGVLHWEVTPAPGVRSRRVPVE